MTDLDLSPEDEGLHRRLGARVAAFMRVGAPLLVAAAGAHFGEDPGPGRAPSCEAGLFSKMMESSVGIGRSAAKRIGAWSRSGDDWARWALAGSAAELVAERYRATGEILSVADAEPYLDCVAEASGLAGARQDAPPEQAPGVADVPLWVDMVRAMGPVVAAIGRHAFAQDAKVLVQSVLVHVRKAAEDAVLRIEGLDGNDRNQALAAVMELAGELYAECHYSELDRILAMTDGERAAYAEEEGEEESLASVFQAFDRHMEMMLVLAQALYRPEGAA